jgi:HEAT repeat protein
MSSELSLEHALSECIKVLSPGNLRNAQALMAKETGADQVLRRFLVAAAKRHDWQAVQNLVVCAFARPSNKYVKILCELLERAEPDLNNEDIVDLLSAIANPLSMDTLSACLDKEYPNDKDRFVNQKIIWALTRIHTPQASNILARAAKSPVDSIREEAQRQLGWRNQQK